MSGHPALWLEDAPLDRAATVRADLRDFLLAGGTITLAEWGAMTPLGRRLATEAGRDVAAERVDGLLAALTVALRETRLRRTIIDAADAGAAECAAGERL